MKFNLFKSLFFVTLLSSANVHAVSDPMERTKDLISALLAAQKTDQNTYRRIDKFMDYDRITSDAIAPHIKKFTPAQADEFKSNLIKLIRLIAYPRSGDLYRKAKYRFTDSKVTKNKALIVQTTRVPKEDMDIEIGFHWEIVNNDWMVIDISFDEDSLVKDYQNQFGRIIEKEGVAGLMKKLDEKIKEFETKNNEI